MRVLTILLLLTGVAMAQQQPPSQMTPINQALSEKILEEINSNVNLRAQIVTLQAKIKELEAKQSGTPEAASVAPATTSTETPPTGFRKPDLTPFKPKPQ